MSLMRCTPAALPNWQPNEVPGVGGIGDEAAVLHYRHNLRHGAGLWVVWMHLDVPGHYPRVVRAPSSARPIRGDSRAGCDREEQRVLRAPGSTEPARQRSSPRFGPRHRALAL